MTRCLLMGFFAAVMIFAAPSATARGQVVVPGDIYTSNSDTVIKHYTSAGSYVGSFSLSSSYGNGIKGMAFGPDGFLYVTVANGTNGFNVVSLNGAGAVQKTYTGPEYVAGNLSYGKITFATNGQFFVGGQDDLRRFTIGNQYGNLVYTNNQVFDATALPNGNLLVLSAYSLQEIKTDGTVVRTINPSVGLGDARGVAYDAATDKIYVTMLGYSGEFFRIMRLDAQTGVVDRKETYNYADDLFITNDNRLLVGSRTLDVATFDLELTQTGTLSGGAQLFVTQAIPVPEPGLILFVSAATLTGAGYLRSRRRPPIVERVVVPH